MVAGEADDIIVRNVTRLAELGCQIDLDDFGTGHSSISTLRRLPVHRLKIDRSFVAKADLDSEQQKMVATILMMAERLDLACLVEGGRNTGRAINPCTARLPLCPRVWDRQADATG